MGDSSTFKTTSATLDPEFNDNVQNDGENKAIQNALDVISKRHTIKPEQDEDNRRIQDMFERGFWVRNPSGTRKIHSKMLYQAVWRTANRMKPLDFSIHGTGRPRDIERIVTAGVGTIMDDGGYLNTLRSKQGTFFNLLMYGDGFIGVSANPEDNEDLPILFNSVSNANVYVDKFATGIRSTSWGRSATKAVAIFGMSWTEFVKRWPEMEDKAGLGRIPREFSGNLKTELEREREGEEGQLDEDLIEVAFAYDIAAENYCVFAGSDTTKILELEGDDYPYVLSGKAYIPILQFMCMPASEGFYNKGIGSMIFELALISQRLMNMEIGHIEDNTYPIELVSVPQGEASEFFNKLSVAHQMRAAGNKGFITVERDAANPSGNAVSSQTLITQNLFNEWTAVMDRLELELRRMGITLDEPESANVTATEILVREENANSFVRQIMEYNASETQFAAELTMDFITEFVSKKSKAPVDLTTSIETPEGSVRADGITMGMISEELKKHHYFVRVNARTGAIPSNALRSAQVARGLEVVAPGTKARTKLMQEFAGIHDLDLNEEDFAQAEPAAAAPGEVPGEPLRTETTRGNINPRVAETTVL